MKNFTDSNDIWGSYPHDYIDLQYKLIFAGSLLLVGGRNIYSALNTIYKNIKKFNLPGVFTKSGEVIFKAVEGGALVASGLYISESVDPQYAVCGFGVITAVLAANKLAALCKNTENGKETYLPSPNVSKSKKVRTSLEEHQKDGRYNSLLDDDDEIKNELKSPVQIQNSPRLQSIDSASVNLLLKRFAGVFLVVTVLAGGATWIGFYFKGDGAIVAAIKCAPTTSITELVTSLGMMAIAKGYTKADKNYIDNYVKTLQ
jgi:hypothetical protein